MDKIEAQHADYPAENPSISDARREYLLARHGTLEIEPLPDIDDADPYNWPSWKKIINLMLVAFHAMMATFTAAAIQSAFVDIALDLNVSIQRASYLTSLVIAILGGAPLFWRPLSERYGRRPILILSLIGSLVGNIGCARSPTYGTMGLCRAITAFFISPAAAIGTAVVSETFFKHQRARYMGIWTVMVTLGVPIAPFIMGFVAFRVGYRWIYWILVCVNAVQLILYVFLGPETRYLRSGQAEARQVSPESSRRQHYFKFRRIDPTPLTWWDFVQPLTLVTRLCVLIPAVAYAMIFLWGSIMVSIEIPQLYPELFHFNTQQVGLQNISLIVGSLIGEQVGGIISDKFMWRRQHKINAAPQPEYRLWLSYIGHALTIAGVVVFLVQIAQATGKWNVTPLIGAAIAATGNQIVTTIYITYAVDCYREEAAAVGVFITFVRQTWGFIGPFWFPDLIDDVGLRATAGIATGFMVVFSIVPTIVLQWKGRSWRYKVE